MKIILREDLSNLGKAGDLVEVRNGYGRNYLLPRALAVPATQANVRQIDHQKRIITAQQAKERASATATATRIGQISLIIKRKVGEQGKLFGSVSTKDVAEAMATAGVPVDRHQIDLKDAIRDLGAFEIPIKLHNDVKAAIKISVVAE